MKIHILSHFPGQSAGKTKDVDVATAKTLIADGVAVDATDGKPHPEAKADKDADKRQVKTDKAATGTETK